MLPIATQSIHTPPAIASVLGRDLVHRGQHRSFTVSTHTRFLFPDGVILLSPSHEVHGIYRSTRVREFQVGAKVRRDSLFSVLLVALALLATRSWAESLESAAVVKTHVGSVRGTTDENVLNFKGIPYAAPPIGELRWALPKPVEPWSGIRDATHFGNGCPQVQRYGLTEAGYNEDCLFLNVTVPRDGKGMDSKRPVLVWIYGGAFVGGSSALYPLAQLAAGGDAVVVSFNYRLGVFGFMAHPGFTAEANGAFGLEDQREALRWVQRNIASFGGDPGNVTIAGESAGAASVCMHLMAPKETSGLYQKAIIQSAGCVQNLRSVQEASLIGEKVSKKVGCADSANSVACMRSKPVKELLEAGAEVAGSDIMTYAPSIGTPTIPKQGLEAFSTGDFVHVPILNGGNLKELLLYVAYAAQAGQPIDAVAYTSRLKHDYGQNETKVEAKYPLSNFPSAPEALGTVLSDFTPLNGLNNCLFLETGKLAAKYVPVYQYQFADAEAPPVTSDPGFPLGAVHSAELPLQFPGFSNTTKLDGPELKPGTALLAKQMLSLWMSFVKDGKPVAQGVPAWPTFHGGDEVLWLEPGRLHLIDGAALHHCGFWSDLYPSLLH